MQDKKWDSTLNKAGGGVRELYILLKFWHFVIPHVTYLMSNAPFHLFNIKHSFAFSTLFIWYFFIRNNELWHFVVWHFVIQHFDPASFFLHVCDMQQGILSGCYLDFCCMALYNVTSTICVVNINITQNTINNIQ